MAGSMSEKPEAAREVHDEHIEQSRHNLQDAHVAIHTDTYDISEDALGNNLPKRYYFSPGFIGTDTVRPLPFPDLYLTEHRPSVSATYQTT
jgi:hypothetical protein